MEKFGTFFINHWELFLALAVTVAMILYQEFWASGRGTKRAGPQIAVGLISHEDALLVDVREDNEFKDGHVVGSTHIPLSKFKERIVELDRHKDRTLIVGCRSGHRSTRACGMLRKRGFEKVYNLDGGLLAWQNANLPLTKKTK